MVEFINRLYLNYHEYQKNVTLINEYYKGKKLLPMNIFFEICNRYSINVFMPNIFLKDNIYGLCMPQFQLA